MVAEMALLSSPLLSRETKFTDLPTGSWEGREECILLLTKPARALSDLIISEKEREGKHWVFAETLQCSASLQ